MTNTIRIIFPASKSPFTLFDQRLRELEGAGFRVFYEELPPISANVWPYQSAPVEERLRILTSALLEDHSDIVLCGRGGYSASDLLPLLPWEDLKKRQPKWLVGFSDISSVQSALWSKLGWPSIHGPMPSSELWGLNSREDISQLLSHFRTEEKVANLSLLSVGETSNLSVDGWLFGGCFSVLTNLIGTPYFPPSLAGAILFLEDIGENPGRLMRFWNQWLQSGVLAGVRGVIVGHLRDLNSALSEWEVKQEFARRSPVPVWSTPHVGHTSPNYPLVIGARATVKPDPAELTWQYSNHV